VTTAPKVKEKSLSSSDWERKCIANTAIKGGRVIRGKKKIQKGDAVFLNLKKKEKTKLALFGKTLVRGGKSHGKKKKQVGEGGHGTGERGREGSCCICIWDNGGGMATNIEKFEGHEMGTRHTEGDQQKEKTMLGKKIRAEALG